jgi:hypothetical protein
VRAGTKLQAVDTLQLTVISFNGQSEKAAVDFKAMGGVQGFSQAPIDLGERILAANDRPRFVQEQLVQSLRKFDCYKSASRKCSAIRDSPHCIVGRHDPSHLNLLFSSARMPIERNHGIPISPYCPANRFWSATSTRACRFSVGVVSGTAHSGDRICTPLRMTERHASPTCATLPDKSSSGLLMLPINVILPAAAATAVPRST